MRRRILIMRNKRSAVHAVAPQQDRAERQEEYARMMEAQRRRFDRAFNDFGCFVTYQNMMINDDDERDIENEATNNNSRRRARPSTTNRRTRRRSSAENRRAGGGMVPGVAAKLFSPLHRLVSVVRLAPQPFPTMEVSHWG